MGELRREEKRKEEIVVCGVGGREQNDTVRVSTHCFGDSGGSRT